MLSKTKKHKNWTLSPSQSLVKLLTDTFFSPATTVHGPRDLHFTHAKPDVDTVFYSTDDNKLSVSCRSLRTCVVSGDR